MTKRRAAESSAAFVAPNDEYKQAVPYCTFYCQLTNYDLNS